MRRRKCWWRWGESHPRPSKPLHNIIHKLGPFLEKSLLPRMNGRRTEVYLPSLVILCGKRVENQVSKIWRSVLFPETGRRGSAHQARLREGRGEGWGTERRSDRTLYLGNDVGSCHVDGLDLRARPSCTACCYIKSPSSKLIHPRFIRSLHGGSDGWNAKGLVLSVVAVCHEPFSRGTQQMKL